MGEIRVFDAHPPPADTVVGGWGQFIRGLRGCQPEPTVFEREFAARVLREVKGLSPDCVHPQYKLLDSDGRTRYIDFAVIVAGRRIAIEIDGADKTPEARRQTHHEDTLLRQNDLVAQGWTVLRFANSQVMHQSARCARALTEALDVEPDSVRGLVTTNAQTGQDEPSMSPAFHPESDQGNRQVPRRRTTVVVAGASVTIILAVIAVLIVTHGTGRSPISEAQQRQTDLSHGAISPLPDGKDCPAKYPVKANYRSDRDTRYFFAPGSLYYVRTTPTSCWPTAFAASQGGYRAP